MFSSDREVEQIARGLMERTLPKRDWTHAAHFAAACWTLRNSAFDAKRDIPHWIRAYNEICGVANTDSSGYHETITQASLRAARAWLEAHAQLPFHEAINSLLESEYGRSDWLLRYWTKDVLFSSAARRGWIAPDLQPLPF